MSQKAEYPGNNKERNGQDRQPPHPAKAVAVVEDRQGCHYDHDRSCEGDQNHDKEDQGEDRDALESTAINK